MAPHTTETDLQNNTAMAEAQARGVVAGINNFATKTKSDYEPKQREFKV